MENNKDIGKAFREKLDQLDVMPSDKLWVAIEKDLPSDRKRKRLLFWIFSSVAITSMLLSGLFFWNQSISEVPSKAKITLDTKNNTSDHLNNTIENPTKINSKHQIVTHETELSENEIYKNKLDTKNNSSNHLNTKIENPTKINAKHQIATTETKSNKNTISKNKYADDFNEMESDSVKKLATKTKVVTNQKGQNPTVTKSKETQLKEKKLNLEQNTNSKKVTSSSAPTTSNVTRSKTSSHKKTVYNYETEKLVNNSKRLVKSTEEYDEYEVVKKYTYVVRKKKIVESGNPSAKPKKIIPNKKRKTNSNKLATSKKKATPKKSVVNSKSLEVETNIPPTQNTATEPEKKEELIIKKDSIIIPIVEKKPKVVAKKEIKKVQDSVPIVKEKKQSIIITPYYGPTYYSSLGKGNSVSGNYRNDPKKGLIKSTYGAYIRWMFSDRVGLRTGIGKTKLSYETSIQKKDTLFLDTRNINLNPDLYQFGIEYQFRKDSEVILRQNLEYYEIPLEGYYDISNKKVGLATAFGISYLFLDKNSLTLRSNTVPEYTIGEASNLVDQSFTGNIKLIAYYKFTKSLSFDIMPSFQYQIIGFKEDVGAFKPYFLTLKAGLSYKF